MKTNFGFNKKNKYQKKVSCFLFLNNILETNMIQLDLLSE